jgi:hypothetical protein
MNESPSRAARVADQAAENAWLKLAGRAAMVIGIPLLGWFADKQHGELVSLRKDYAGLEKQIGKLETAQQRVPDQLLIVEGRINARVQQLETRQDSLSSRQQADSDRISDLVRITTDLATKHAVLLERMTTLIELNKQPPLLGPPRR